jgi:hypothetical protein
MNQNPENQNVLFFLAQAAALYLLQRARPVATGGKRVINPAELLVEWGLAEDFSEALTLVKLLERQNLLRPVRVIEDDSPRFVYQLCEELCPRCQLTDEGECLVNERLLRRSRQKLVELGQERRAIKAQQAALDKRQARVEDEILHVLIAVEQMSARQSAPDLLDDMLSPY